MKKSKIKKNLKKMKRKIKNKGKKLVYPTKVCTLCGYIYVKKQVGNQKACIFYYYTSKCTWLKEKIIKFDVITLIGCELFCQFSIVGFNSQLYVKLYEKYSFEKNIKFFTALIIICVAVGFFFSIISDDLQEKRGENNGHEQEEEQEEEKEQDKEKQIKTEQKFLKMNDFCDDDKCGYLVLTLVFIFMFLTFTFINSMCYYFDNNKKRERWDNIIMAEFIFFKSIDLAILSFFDFFDNSDIFITALFITLEKFIWMIIEEVFDAVELKEKILIIIQIVISSLPVITIFLYIFEFICFLCCPCIRNKWIQKRN